jgi:hypothetical protein
MSQHLSTETWTVMEARTFLHIETSADCDVAGRHICSIPKKEHTIASLIMLAPELLALAYGVVDGLTRLELEEKAADILKRFSAYAKK